MRKKYCFLGLFAALLLAGGFLAVSCKKEKTVLAEPAVPKSGARGAESGAEKAAADAALLRVSPPLLLPGAGERQDLILVTYLDPALKAEVVGFFRNLTGSSEVAELILSNAVEFDIPPALAFSLCAEESNYNIRALNRNHNNSIDRGLFQLNSASFPNLEVEDFYNPKLNARYGLAHLRWCLNSGGTEVAGLAMYNAGHARVSAAGTPKHTLDYISRILKRQRRIEELFLAEYPRIAQEFAANENEKLSIRLSLLTPLGGR